MNDFKKGDLIRIKRTVGSGSWGIKGQIGEVIGPHGAPDAVSIKLFIKVEENRDSVTYPQGFGKYTKDIEHL